MAKKELSVVGEKAPSIIESLPAAALPVMTFDAWWLLTQQRLNLKVELKQPIYKHMQAKGFLDKHQFDEGLANFGIKS